MAVREEVVKKITAVFAVQIERWDDHNYPYQHTESLWEDHLQAAEAIRDTGGNEKRKIVLRHLDVLNTGRVVWHDVKTVWEDDEWVSDEHNPLTKDPQYREYLRLKKIYGKED